MPIVEADIIYRLSTKSGAAGDTTASTPAESLGKYVSTTEVGAGLNNLFDDISGDENAASDVEYRCIFVLNNHATLTLQNAVLWIVSQVSGGADAAIGLDPTAISAKGASAAQAVEIADENTAPAGVTFSTPGTKGAGLAIGNLGPGQVKAFHLRRAATNSAALSNDGITWRVEGDTAQ